MKQQLEQALSEIISNLYAQPVEVALDRTEEKFGDFATNIAMQLAGKLGKPPREIALQIQSSVLSDLSDLITKVEIAGPGFINLTVSDSKLAQTIYLPIVQTNANKRVLLEYSCPNAFKELHTGHMYQTVVGDALGKLLESTGATVFRANFGGDVGLHVAKCLYGVVRVIGDDVDSLSKITENDRPSWISQAYVAGSQAYESNEAAKQEITTLNTQVYEIHKQQDRESTLARIYWTCREWSYDYFKSFYEAIEVDQFDRYYPESTTIEPGLEVVRQHTGKVFELSDNAIVFKGEDVGLHTRVFVTSKGLPTYETKDLGVIYSETKDFEYDHRIIITGADQIQYMQVVFAALKAMDPDLAAKQTHLAHGTIRFGTGQKMSSRLGNVTRAVEVIEAVADMLKDYDTAIAHQVTLGAIKYSFLKHRLGGDISFDINESVSLEGNSGPYLQYAYARACSILRKKEDTAAETISDLEPGERTLVRKLSEYNDVVVKATSELMPHHICGYLYELAQTFNRFYEHNRVLGSGREAVRLELVKAYANTLRSGLELLGLPTPEKM